MPKEEITLEEAFELYRVANMIIDLLNNCGLDKRSANIIAGLVKMQTDLAFQHKIPVIGKLIIVEE